MREIKFRAWSNVEKIMFDDVVVTGGIIHLKWSQGGYDFTEFVSEYSDYYYDDKVYKLMQFTGLTDKNGNKIYESDVLSYWGFPFVVTFQNSAFGWIEDNEFHSFDSMAISEISKTKIIGNIYENPELLTA